MVGACTPLGGILPAAGYAAAVRSVGAGHVRVVRRRQGGDRRRRDGLCDDVRHLRAVRGPDGGPLQPQVDGDDRRRRLLSRHLRLGLRRVGGVADPHLRHPERLRTDVLLSVSHVAHLAAPQGVARDGDLDPAARPLHRHHRLRRSCGLRRRQGRRELARPVLDLRRHRPRLGRRPRDLSQGHETGGRRRKR